MTYEFTISLGIKDFQRLLEWGQSVEKLRKDDKDLAKKLEFILIDMIEEEKEEKEIGG